MGHKLQGAPAQGLTGTESCLTSCSAPWSWGEARRSPSKASECKCVST